MLSLEIVLKRVVYRSNKYTKTSFHTSEPTILQYDLRLEYNLTCTLKSPKSIDPCS